MTEKTKATKPAGRKHGSRVLTPKEKATAIALWRAGDATLEDLAKKFGRRPETFSRLFKRMGIEKGSSVAERAKELEKAAAAAAVSGVEETMRRIAQTKDEHFKMANGLAKLAWAEIVRARTAGLPLDTLKDVMATLKLAGDVIGNARKELYTVLNVEEHDKKSEDEDLPELTVRELTPSEVTQLANQAMDDGMDDAPISEDDLDIPE